MAGWKNHHFEDVSPIKNGDVPAIAMLVLQGCILFHGSVTNLMESPALSVPSL